MSLLALAAALPCAAADDSLTTISIDAITQEWRQTLLRLRPELAGLVAAIKIRVVTAGEMKKFSRRPNVEGHYDWTTGEVAVNRALLTSLHAKAAAKTSDADRAVALLTFDVIDHEISGHADAVRRLEKVSGRYSGKVIDEEVTAFAIEAEGLTRAYADPAFRQGIAAVPDLARQRHQEILGLIPLGVAGFKRVVHARGYGLPNVAAKVKEYNDYADRIKKMKMTMMGQTDEQAEADAAVKRARENAQNLERFYVDERVRLETLLSAAGPSPY